MVAMARRGVATAIALNGSKSWNKIENHSLDLVGKAAEEKNLDRAYLSLKSSDETYKTHFPKNSLLPSLLMSAEIKTG